MSKKTLTKKQKLAKARRQNRRVPLFAVAKTARKATSSKNRRDWRTQKLRIKEE